MYAGVAVFSMILAGWSVPEGAGWLFFGTGILLSGAIGVARGQLTRVWLASDGRALRQGTALTVGLFGAMLAAKIGLGIYAESCGVHDGASFGGVLIVIAIMVAVQAEIVFRRASMLRGPKPLQTIEVSSAG